MLESPLLPYRVVIIHIFSIRSLVSALRLEHRSELGSPFARDLDFGSPFAAYTSTNRSSIGLIWSGTSSGERCPEPIVWPVIRFGHIFRKRFTSPIGAAAPI